MHLCCIRRNASSEPARLPLIPESQRGPSQYAGVESDQARIRCPISAEFEVKVGDYAGTS